MHTKQERVDRFYLLVMTDMYLTFWH